jgi:hypothetical protein
MYCARFEVLAGVLLKIHVFLDVMPNYDKYYLLLFTN